MEIRVERTQNPKPKFTDESKLGFGHIFTDHMFCMNWDEGQGWHDARIVPEADFSMSPASSILHYGQTTFEGLKAYRWQDGSIALFRPQENIARMNRSNRRVCMPELPPEETLEALRKLIDIERDWVPSSEGTSLYIRPVTLGTEAVLGVHPSSSYLYYIILSPSGSYYKGGLAPTRIYVEDEYVRAVRGGLGEAKTAANYVASLIAGVNAKKNGADQVLWLDGVERKYIEEVGAMNILFVIDGKVVTPELNGSILPGITRKSVLQVARDMGYGAEERRIGIEEVLEGIESGRVTEVFGAGTAAVVSPVGTLIYKDKEYTVADGGMGELTEKFYNALTGIQWGHIPDIHNWIVKV